MTAVLMFSPRRPDPAKSTRGVYWAVGAARSGEQIALAVDGGGCEVVRAVIPSGREDALIEALWELLDLVDPVAEVAP